MADETLVNGSLDVNGSVTASALSGNTAKASMLDFEGNTINVNLPSAPTNPKPSIIVGLVDGIRKARDPVGYEKARSEATLIALETERKIYEQYKALYPSMGEQRLFLLAHGYNMTDAQAENVIDVMNRATELIDKTPEKLPDAEFVDNFVESSKQAYSDDIRDMFSRLLSGELDSPGSYSKRVMSILANMSGSDAADFKKLCSYIAKFNGLDFLAMNSDKGGASYNDGGMTYSVLSGLGTLGLVDMGGMQTITLYDNFSARFEMGSYSLIVFKADGADVKIQFRPLLTKAGLELSSLCPERDHDALENIFKRLESNGEVECFVVNSEGRLERAFACENENPTREA